MLSFILPPALGRAKAEARAELVSAALHRDLHEPVQATVAATYGDLERQLASGAYSMAWVPAAVCATMAPVQTLFTIVREGQASYLSTLVARRASHLTLATLRGTRAAWVDPLSVGGYLLATARLRAEGVDPERTFTSQRFVGSHRAAIEAVLHEEADVAAVSIIFTEPEAMTQKLRWYGGPAADRLVALAFTERCLNDAIAISPSVPDAEARRIADKLAPRTGRCRLLTALEADDLIPAHLDDYHRLAPLLGLSPPPPSRRSQLPPPRGAFV